MKTAFRSLMMLAVAVWLGGLVFFPFVAQAAFASEANRQAAGLIVGASLKELHELGLASGAALLALLGVGQIGRVFHRPIYPAAALVVVMLGVTAASQFVVIPRMEADRIAAGGSISLAPLDDPNRLAFEVL